MSLGFKKKGDFRETCRRCCTLKDGKDGKIAIGKTCSQEPREMARIPSPQSSGRKSVTFVGTGGGWKIHLNVDEQILDTTKSPGNIV